MVFAYQFNATKGFLGLKRKKIHQSSSKFHRQVISFLHPIKHLHKGEPQPTPARADMQDISHAGAVCTGCIKVHREGNEAANHVFLFIDKVT